MSEPLTTGSAPDAGRPSTPVGRVWAGLVNGLAVIGTAMIGVLMVIICADVVARNALGASLPLVSELGALLLVMIVYLALATTVRADRLARTDLIYEAIKARSPRAGALLAALFDLTGAVVMAVIAWSTWGTLRGEIDSAQYIGVTGVLTLPTWPFFVLILVGMAAGAVQFALRTVAALRLAAGTEGRA